MKSSLVIRAFFALMLCCFAVDSVCGQTKEYRMMWITRYQWPSSNQTTAKSRIDTYFTKLKDNNFNAVLFQVRGQCDVHYPSTLDPWSNDYSWRSPGWDPLAYALTSAKNKGLELHAYFNTHTMKSPTPPASTTPQHVYNLHGPNAAGTANDWRIHDANGNPVETTDGYVWISPGHPEASLHTRRAVMELITNYAVDGVHFDRIRCPANIYSHDPTTEARYAGDGNPDGVPWGDFMRRQITDDLRRIYGQAAMIRPSVKFSAAPFGIILKNATTQYQGTGTQAYSSWFQDSWRWLKEGCLDFMVPQIYWEVGSSHPYEKLLADWQNNRGERIVVGGSTVNDDSSKTAAKLLQEIDQTRTQSAAGWCVYTYTTMLAAHWDAVKTKFTSTAQVPDMPWKTAPTKGIITGYVKDHTGAVLTDARIVLDNDPLKNANGTASYNHLTGADGFYAILNVPPGTAHRLTFTKSGKVAVTTTTVTVTAGAVTQVDATFTGEIPPQPPAVTKFVESRVGSGYTEVTGTFADTTAKSTAAGLSATGSRYNSSLGATATFTPALTGAGAYNVYITLSSGSNNNSPGAGWTLTNNGVTLQSGTVDLTNANTNIVNKWLLLCGPVDLPAGGLAALHVVNNNAASASTGGRFVMDAVKFEAVRNADVDEWQLF